MPKPRWKHFVLSLLCTTACVAAPQASPADRAWQLLETKCLSCHGVSNPAGLDLHYRDSILKGGKSGPAAIPGNGESSLLYRAAAHIGRLKMPPGSQAPLSQQELDTLKQWIDAGLPAPSKSVAQSSHWAFKPMVKVVPPDDPSGWSRNEIDRFIIEKLRANSLEPVAAADKRTLLRRAYFNLIGLSPTPEELSAFLADNSPSAYSEVIEKLLASPRYGGTLGKALDGRCALRRYGRR